MDDSKASPPFDEKAPGPLPAAELPGQKWQRVGDILGRHEMPDINIARFTQQTGQSLKTGRAVGATQTVLELAERDFFVPEKVRAPLWIAQVAGQGRIRPRVYSSELAPARATGKLEIPYLAGRLASNSWAGPSAPSRVRVILMTSPVTLPL